MYWIETTMKFKELYFSLAKIYRLANCPIRASSSSTATSFQVPAHSSESKLSHKESTNTDGEKGGTSHDCHDSNSETAPRNFTCPENSRLLRVALIGLPNAGKSTLINTLMQYEVCPASKRIHTTRKPQRAVFLEDNTQIVFIDTPGVVNHKEIEKFNFKNEFTLGPRKSMKGADVVGVIHDISNRILRTNLDKRLTTLLNQYPEKKFFLILNKVDLLKSKRKLLDTLRILTNGIIAGKQVPFEIKKKEKVLTTDQILKRATQKLEEQDNSQNCGAPVLNEMKVLGGQQESDEDEVETSKSNHGWSNFDEVFMISSLTGDGIEDLKDYLIKQAKTSRWDFSEEVLTDYSPPDLTLLLLKSKILEFASDEAPYKVTPVLEIWEENERGDLTIVIGIKCPNARTLKILIGARGSTISLITHETEKTLMKLLRRHVSLHIKAICPEEKKQRVG